MSWSRANFSIAMKLREVERNAFEGPLTLCSVSRDGQITAILDQKNYVEELNRHLR